MNARQLAIRTAAFARDYSALDRLFDAGATTADVMYALLGDVLRSGDAHLLELVLCSAPDLDLDMAFAIERNVRAGKLGAGSNEVVAMHIRAVFWKLLLVREMLDDGSDGDDEELASLADAAKAAAERAIRVVDDTVVFIEASNRRIAEMDAVRRPSQS